jgi:hypothetical protein
MMILKQQREFMIFNQEISVKLAFICKDNLSSLDSKTKHQTSAAN